MKTNVLFWLVLAANVGMYCLDTLAGWLNLRALRPELPAEFRDVYDEKEYRRFLNYTAATANFERIEATWDLAVLVLFWFLGGYGWLDRGVRSFDLGPISSGLIYIGALFLGHMALGLPLEIYETFRIEERFGFNKTTPATFAADQVKSLLLSVVLGGPLLALVLAAFQHGGSHAWLYAWAIAAVLLVAMSFAAPAIVLPLFNKLTPLEDGELRRSILQYAERLRFPIGEIFLMDGSRRSTKANAFFTGFGQTKRVVLLDTLVKNHGAGELVAVLAHEIGHYKLRHIPQHIGMAILNIGIFLFLADRLLRWPELYAAFGVAQPSVYVGLALFLVIYDPLSRVLSIIRGAQSRRHEYAADRFAAKTTGEPEALSQALKNLSRQNLGNLAPHPLYVLLYHSHPPILQRVRELEKLAAA